MRLPLFRDTHLGPVYPVAQILDEIRHPERRIVEVDLTDLEREATRMRGIYEASWPTLAGWLTVASGEGSSRWLDRMPDFQRARRPMQSYVTLYEVTPVEDQGGLLIYRWRLVVRGEAERRAAWLIAEGGRQARSAGMVRMEAAG